MMKTSTSKNSLYAPDYSFRYESKDILAHYGSLEKAFENGAYLLVAEFSDMGSELEGCGLVLGGAVGSGLRVLNGIPSKLTNRGYLCKAFAEWVFGDTTRALTTLSGAISESNSSSEIKKFKKLLEKEEIRVFITAAFLSNQGKGIKTENTRFGRFSVNYVGTQLENNSYDYSPGEPFDEFLGKLDPKKRPDFIYCMTPQWPTPHNLEKINIPKVIWCHDGDMFLYRSHSAFSAYDVKICLTSLEQFEMNNAVPGLCLSNFMSDPLNTDFPQFRTRSSKDFDLVFTGSPLDGFHTEKSRFMHKLLGLSGKYKIAFVDGYLEKDNYFKLLSQAKFVPIVSRIAGNPSPRWRDALASSAFVLYPEGTTYGKAFPGCFPIRTNNIGEDICAHLERYDNGDPAYDPAIIFPSIRREMDAYRAEKTVLFERQLKLAAFSAFVLKNPKEMTSQHKTGTEGIYQEIKTQQIWPTPAIDTSIYGAENIFQKIGKIAAGTSNVALVHEKGINDLANIYSSLAVMAPNSSKKTFWRSQANLLYKKGCDLYPQSLILHFNQAHWTFFQSRKFNIGAPQIRAELGEPCAQTDGSSAAALFRTLIRNWSDFTFNPLGMTVAMPFTLHEADQVFPHYDYAQLASSSTMKINAGKSLLDLKNLLKGAAHGYLGWHALENNEISKGLDYIEKGLSHYPNNFPLNRFNLEMNLRARNHKLRIGSRALIQTRTTTANTIAECFLNCVNIFPAILLTHTHEVASAFVEANRTADLKMVLEDWYRFANLVYSPDDNERYKITKNQLINILQYEKLFPNEVLKKLGSGPQVGEITVTQFDRLLILAKKERKYPFYQIHLLKQFLERARKPFYLKTINLVSVLLLRMSLYDKFKEGYNPARMGEPFSSIGKASSFTQLCFLLTKASRGRKHFH